MTLQQTHRSIVCFVSVMHAFLNCSVQFGDLEQAILMTDGSLESAIWFCP